MKRFQTKSRRALPGLWLLPVLCLAALLLFSLALDSLSAGNRLRQKEALEKALMRCITQCYAAEGFYPESLAYMQEHYKLSYNPELFYVDYRASASNLFPEVTILER